MSGNGDDGAGGASGSGYNPRFSSTWRIDMSDIISLSSNANELTSKLLDATSSSGEDRLHNLLDDAAEQRAIEQMTERHLSSDAGHVYAQPIDDEVEAGAHPMPVHELHQSVVLPAGEPDLLHGVFAVWVNP